MTREYYVATLDGDFILHERTGIMSVGFKTATQFQTLEQVKEIVKGMTRIKIFRVEINIVPVE